MKRSITMMLMALVLGVGAVSSAEAQRVIIRRAPVVYYDPFFYDPFWTPSYYVPKTPEQIQAENEARAVRHQRHEEKKLEKQRQHEEKQRQKELREQRNENRSY